MTDAHATTVSLARPASLPEAEGRALAQVKCDTLLLILIVAPVFAIMVLSDRLFFGGGFHHFLLRNPAEIAYWAAAFSTPHIIASWLTFADREYIDYYRKPLRRALIAAALLGLTVPFIFGGAGVLIVMCFITIHHNQQQQYGLSLMMLRTAPTRDFVAWKWLSIIAAGTAYSLLLGAQVPFIAALYHEGLIVMLLLGGASAFFALRFALEMVRRPGYSRTGMMYFAGVVLELAICGVLFLADYGPLALIIPKISHSLTAFAIYIVHEQNRNAGRWRNPLYLASRKIGISPVLTFFVISLAVALTLCHVLSSYYVVGMFVIFLNFMHYYMEGHMWKRGTPHRQNVPFA